MVLQPLKAKAASSDNVRAIRVGLWSEFIGGLDLGSSSHYMIGRHSAIGSLPN